MRTRTLRNIIGIAIGFTLLTFYAFTLLSRSNAARNPGASLAGATQMLKIAQTEKFQSEFKFAESNADAAKLVGNQVRLGKIDSTESVIELNVREGGVIEYLLDKKDGEGKPLRVIHLPRVGDPAGSVPLSWQCYSANWRGVSRAWSSCSYDETAWEKERKHVAGLRASIENTARENEESRRKRESEIAQSEFERDRARSLREAERAREEEERQLAQIERETERARIDNDRLRRSN